VELRARLLTAVAQGRFRPVGSVIEGPISVRLVASSTQELDEHESRSASILPPSRLEPAVVRVPPLRARVGDLQLLVRSLLHDLGREDLAVSPDALAALARGTWVGNVRELRCTIAYALLRVDSSTLERRHLDLAGKSCRCDPEPDPDVDRARQRVERVAIRHVLAQSQACRQTAASQLGLSLAVLAKKIHEYAL